MAGRRTLVIRLGLVATLLLITLITAPLASAQNIPPSAKPANLQVPTRVSAQVTNQGLPPVRTPTVRTPTVRAPTVRAPQRQPSRLSQPAPTDAPKDVAKDLAKNSEPLADSTPAPVVPSPEPTTATTPQSTNAPLPFMANTETESREQPPSASGLLVRTLGALLLIIGLIVAAAWGMKRFGGARFGSPKENAPEVAILNSVSLGDKRSLTIVRYGSRTLLLGSTAQSVTLLAEDDTEDFESHPRSVADILNDEDPAAFSQELFSATKHLNEHIETRH